MSSRGLVLNEYVSKVAYQAVAKAGESTLLPIIDQQSGEPEGVLVASSLERIVVCGREQAVLSLTDIKTVQRTMTRVQACRAVLYVPAEMVIPVLSCYWRRCRRSMWCGWLPHPRILPS